MLSIYCAVLRLRQGKCHEYDANKIWVWQCGWLFVDAGHAGWHFGAGGDDGSAPSRFPSRYFLCDQYFGLASGADGGFAYLSPA